LSTQAEGGHDGVTAAGPDNKYDGVYPCSEMDGNTDTSAPSRIRQSWQTGEGAPASSGFALGANRPD